MIIIVSTIQLCDFQLDIFAFCAYTVGKLETLLTQKRKVTMQPIYNITVKDASEKLDLHPSNILRQIYRETIPAKKKNGKWYINNDGVEFLGNLKPGPKPNVAVVYLRKYGRSNPKYGQYFLEARSGKNGTGKRLTKIEIENLKSGFAPAFESIQKFLRKENLKMINMIELGKEDRYEARSKSLC